MSKSDAFESDILKLIFNATGIANLADNTATGPLANLYLSLHTADPTDAGNQASNECTYTGYARVAVARSAAGFIVSGTNPTQAALAAIASFPQRTDAGATQTATYFGVGVAASGATKLLYSGAITTPAGGIAISQNVTPQLGTGTIITED